MLRWAIILGFAWVVLGGCQTVSRQAPQDSLSYRTREGDPPSLVFRVPQIAALDAAGEAWYAGRNDYRPGTSAGLRSATVEATTTYTIDRQHIFNGRVRDHYRTTTYSTRHTQTVR